MRLGLLNWLGLSLVAFLGCAPKPSSRDVFSAGKPGAAFRSAKFDDLDATILQAISNRAAPGAVVWLERAGSSYHRAYGQRAVLPVREAMTEDTIFDAASLTKVLATTPAVMLLAQGGRIRLDAPLANYLPEFTGEGRERVTIQQLLTHTSGLRPGIPLRPEWTGHDSGIQRALAEKPEVLPDMRFRYSDVNFILLGELVQRVSATSLDDFCARKIYAPLGMTNTGFRPAAGLRMRIAPTTMENGKYLRGVVHDPTARRMGGVAGHAGLFTTAADVARFSRMMLNDRLSARGQLFTSRSIQLMTQVQTPPSLPEARRGLGWDIDSPYAGPRGEYLPVGSYGHTGWTGTSLWIDPFSGTFVILLSNRNHPTEDGNVIALRRRVGTLAAEAVEGFNFAGVLGSLPRQARAERSGSGLGSIPSGAPSGVQNGVDVLEAQGFAPLRRLKIGLITNHTGTNRDRNPTIDLLKGAAEVELRALFTPEHGLRGLLDEKVADGTDPKTGLPVYSLYGDTRQPRPEHLLGLDALVFDIQDIGCRFYTYISTLGLCLEAASQNGIRFFVLDRVNPIKGTAVDGPVSAESTHDFVAFHPIPLRHGMTVGELALMFNAEREWHASLTVIPIQGWRRDQWYDETGLPWINTSPNMRNLKQAILYPGVGLIESAVSVGRGTDTPFEVVGAPYANDVRLARELNAAGLPGIRFVPIRFTPRASIFKDEICGGVYLMLTDRDTCPVVDVGILLAMTFHRLYPQAFAWTRMQPLLQHPATLEAIRSGKSLAQIKALWATDLGEFLARREAFLLY